MSYLCYLCWYAHSGIQQLLCCSVFCFFFFFVTFFILCALIRQFRWTVHFSLLLQYSLTFISSEKNDQRRYKFLTKKISKFLFLAVEDIIVLSPHTRHPIQDQNKIRHFILCESLHHDSNIIFIPKTTILLHKYF
jgi:hypothetical protein